MLNNNLNKHSLEGFIEYAKEANTRSTLAVEDGLKPVHRRILFGMYEEGFTNDKPYGGSAKIVGSVLGNYHPHGDASVYDAAIRLSQDFKLRYPLVDFYGNNGSILDPDSYAASRYTKMRLSAFGANMLVDIQKNTVPMIENYNGELMEPVVLPSMIPNALLNGGMGIGVGISSSLVPHNLGEVCDAINAYIKNPRITTEELMKSLSGPDFPTGGIITDGFNLSNIYDTGKGTVKVRAKYRIESINGRSHIIITEAPYLINIENRIIAPIQQMVVEEGYDKIYDIQNNSGKNGLEIRIILEKDVNPQTVLKTLFEKTGLETTIKINNTVMLSDGSFVTLGLRGLISYYLKHQHSILTKKYQWELDKAEARLNIVEGLIIAIENIDEVVKMIKESTNTQKAKMALMSRFELNDKQAAAILDMRLARLTSLEINKLLNEKAELIKSIEEYELIIQSSNKRETIITKFLTELKTKYNDKRRTTIAQMTIVEKGEHVYLVIDGNNKIKSIPKDEIATMTRGKKGTTVSKEYVISALECNTKDTIMIVDILGKAYLSKVSSILDDEFPLDTAPAKLVEVQDKDFLIFVTQAGIIKKIPTPAFKKATQVTKIREEDSLIGVHFANDDEYVMVLGTGGKVVNIPVAEIPTSGKLAYGAKGILTDQVLDSTVAATNDLILTITAENKAKLTNHSNFLVNARATTGQLTTEDCEWLRSIDTHSFITVFGEDGRAITINVNSLAIKGRNSVGARIFNSKITAVISL